MVSNVIPLNQTKLIFECVCVCMFFFLTLLEEKYLFQKLEFQSQRLLFLTPLLDVFESFKRCYIPVLINLITVNLQMVTSTSEEGQSCGSPEVSFTCLHTFHCRVTRLGSAMPLLPPTQASGLPAATGWISSHFHPYPFIFVVCYLQLTFRDDVNIESRSELWRGDVTLLHTCKHQRPISRNISYFTVIKEWPYPAPLI